MAVGDTYIIRGYWSSESGEVGDAISSFDESGPLDPSFEITEITVVSEFDIILTTQMLTNGTLPVTDDMLVIDYYGSSIAFILTADVTLAEEQNAPVARKIRLISFTYSSEIVYEIELGNKYMRFFHDDIYLAGSDLQTPYLTEHLREIQYDQIADTMWLVHPLYAPRKLTRDINEAFSLNIIPFKKGPFLLRNDLIDPDVTETAYMLYAPDAGMGTDVGDTGTLTCQDSVGVPVSFFDAGHAPEVPVNTVDDGALFKLINNRWNKVTKGKLTGTNTGILCKAIDIKGSYRWTTHGRWTALIELQKNENGAGWETVESYEGEKDINVPTATKTEENYNVQYRVNVSDEEGKRASSTIKSSITVLNDVVEGIVRVTEWVSDTIVNVVVVAKMESVAITGITAANPAVVTATDHNLGKGDKIWISNVTGSGHEVFVNGSQTVLKVLTKNTFQLDTDLGGYTFDASSAIITPPSTRRWAEGAWSRYRGYPKSVTFFEGRCNYGGMSEIAPQVVGGGGE